MMTGEAQFGGSCIALVTPFRDGAVDETAFRQLVSWQIEQGTRGLLPAGTTGETPTLSHDEHKRVTEICIDETKGRAQVLAGAGSNCTAEAVDFAIHAEGAGADALLVVTPYYNKPTQAGLIRHYTAIADAVSTPVIIYDIPGRSVVAMSNATMAELAKHPNIAGVKDSSTDLARPTQLLNLIGPGFSQLSGEDGTALAHRVGGGHGCISVTANVAPGLLAEMHSAFDQGDITRAMEINALLMPLHEALFCESSPGPVKYALGLMGKCEDGLRAPLGEIADTSKKTVKAALRHVGILS
jgi:4-hydroxy-tetrahydrodipicolinate synthase